MALDKKINSKSSCFVGIYISVELFSCYNKQMQDDKNKLYAHI